MTIAQVDDASNKRNAIQALKFHPPTDPDAVYFRRNLISLVVVMLVALLMGFRSGAGVLAWLAVAGILIVFTLALTWIARRHRIRGHADLARYPREFGGGATGTIRPSTSPRMPTSGFEDRR